MERWNGPTCEMEAERQEASLHVRGLFQAREEEGLLMGVGPPSNGRAYQRPWGVWGVGTHTPLEGRWHGVGRRLEGRWQCLTGRLGA